MEVDEASHPQKIQRRGTTTRSSLTAGIRSPTSTPTPTTRRPIKTRQSTGTSTGKDNMP
eukprot:CAMPEP_0182424098 /NCGR_PEP_ID=MMETSP1167-20130531/10253_1 /TAXON_ID=2988 /ORGANISM="Mallomonas Sp, Strain CCMP3275" /LENGTH=58 /DNA_ID=CAMNT_0024603643 /DNA_START=84 /DNA_END=257 /DNA_ORIENTATION=-